MTNLDEMNPLLFPPNSTPNRRIVLVDLLRSGQPRPYADTERAYRVTIRYYDYLGNLVLLGSAMKTMLKQHALSAVGGDRHVQLGERKHDTMDDHFKTYVDSIEAVGNHSVDIVIKEPYTD